MRFAEALTDLGILGAARLHLEQAVALSDHAKATQDQLRALLARADYAEKGEVYFVSFSDASPPYRQSRETGGYNRKNEPAFPDYGRAENRASIAASESKRLPIFFHK